MVKKRFSRFVSPDKNLAVVGSMMPYYGQHSVKNMEKPTHFGFKVWSINTTFDYCVQMEPYQGARITNTELGLWQLDGMGSDTPVNNDEVRQQDDAMELKIKITHFEANSFLYGLCCCR